MQDEPGPGGNAALPLEVLRGRKQENADAPTREKAPSVTRALAWVRGHEAWRGGIRVHSSRRDPYPEVTGYLVPTLLDYGEMDLAARCVRWLVRIQRPDGAYLGPDGLPYVFDTGQALRGLLAASRPPEARQASRRAADYLVAQLVEQGRGGFGKRYKERIPETIHLYALPPLYKAAKVFREERYREGAARCLEFYQGHEELLRLGDLTHFIGYELEGLIDMGRAAAARPTLDLLAQRQMPDGGVSAREDVSWVCTPGMAQLALCWFKIGMPEPANRAMRWLEAHQERSGGFRGSYGPGATYFPDVELPWAVKFYLDACRMRPQASHVETAKGPGRIERDENRPALHSSDGS